MAFNTSQIGAMAALVDVDKMTHEDAAKKWLADNKAAWSKFTK
jgi:glycine betaine/proline transport system substrate-binding protein